jgi:hypothetical protein
MRADWLLAALFALCLTFPADAAESGDRRERFKELARRYAEATEPASATALLSEIFALADAEVLDNLSTGGPFASAAFIQERLEAFAEEWGGATFRILQPEGGAKNPLTFVLGTMTRGEPRASLRIYARALGEAVLRAGVIHDGAAEFHAWPAGRDRAFQVLTSWLGTPTGRGSRPLHLELWRHGGREGVRRVWTSDDAFPAGLWATDFAVQGGQVRLRYEARYPGWKPGCEDETEHEDVYRQPAGSDQLVLWHRRVVNGWHRELHAAVTRFFEALAADNRKTLAELVPDQSLRKRLPRQLEPDPACDQRNPRAPATVIVASRRGRDSEIEPWSLSWRLGPRGWRLAAALPVLQ